MADREKDEINSQIWWSFDIKTFDARLPPYFHCSDLRNLKQQNGYNFWKTYMF